MDLKLKGKNVIVTGGSKGIGAGICKVFACEGANLIINYRSDPVAAQRFADDLIRNWGIRAVPVYADMTCPEDIDRLYREAEKQFPSLDVLVNNAACNVVFKPFQDYTADEWKEAQQGILDPVFYMSRLFVKHCIAQEKGGHIVNILSKSAILSSSICNLTYVANKGALTALTRGMAKEFVRYGIIVNGIIPGYVKTENQYIDGNERTERVRVLLPLKRFAQPEEIGNTAAILSSPLFAQMIGTIVDCTGGTLI